MRMHDIVLLVCFAHALPVSCCSLFLGSSYGEVVCFRVTGSGIFIGTVLGLRGRDVTINSHLL